MVSSAWPTEVSSHRADRRELTGTSLRYITGAVTRGNVGIGMSSQFEFPSSPPPREGGLGNSGTGTHQDWTAGGGDWAQPDADSG